MTSTAQSQDSEKQSLIEKSQSILNLDEDIKKMLNRKQIMLYFLETNDLGGSCDVFQPRVAKIFCNDATSIGVL